MRWIKATVKYLIITLMVVALAITAFLTLAPTFGAASGGESLARIEASDNFRDGQFHNIITTAIDTSDPDQPQSIAAYLFPSADKNPQSPLPSKSLEVPLITPGKFAWLGHSTILFNAGGKYILTDPVFNRASPVPFYGKPFALENPTTIDDLPKIDVVIISHDHYDHLDHLAIMELDNKVDRFLVPLGLSAHLQRWGVAAEKITELDWYDNKNIHDITFTLLPARHFSGRGITNGFSTLWGSWAVATSELNVWFSGDSGYFDELATIGKKYGPFDIAFIENGAYSNNWNQIHMMPEQAVQASLDLRAKVFFPIHWGKFDLALHPWDEPIRRATKAASRQGVSIATPLIGEVFSVEDVPGNHWWKSVD